MCTAAGKVPGYCCVAIFWAILAHSNYTSALNLTLLCLRCFGKLPFASPGVHRISSYCELQCSSSKLPFGEGCLLVRRCKATCHISDTGARSWCLAWQVVLSAHEAGSLHSTSRGPPISGTSGTSTVKLLS